MCSMATVRAMNCHSQAACCSGSSGGASKASRIGTCMPCHAAGWFTQSSLAMGPAVACFGGLAKACLCSVRITHRVVRELGRPLCEGAVVRLNAGVTM